MGSFILFVLFFFLLLIAVPIINIIGVVRSVRNKRNYQDSQQQSTSYNEGSSTASPVNKRFDKSKAEDVEFEEV